MSDKLNAAVAALNEEVADTNGKLASIKTFVEGVPALAAAAVADALAAANVADDAAAALIDGARQSVSDNVDATLAAINANSAPGDAGGDGPPAVDPTA